MGKGQMIALGLLALALLAGIVLTWGSMGSIVLCFGLITMGASLLYQRFLNREDPDDWDQYQ